MAKLSRRKLAAYAARQLQSGAPTNSVLQQIAAYLIDSGRANEAPLVARDIEASLASSGLVIGTITSARPLSKSALSEVELFIKASDASVETVMLREQIDESLIGGMKLELPGRQLDASVKAKLMKITV